MKFKANIKKNAIEIKPKKTKLHKLVDSLMSIPHLKNVSIGDRKPDDIIKQPDGSQISFREIQLTFDSPEDAQNFHKNVTNKLCKKG